MPIKKEGNSRIIWVKVESPDYLGEFNVTFVDDKGRSDYIKLHRNCSLWTSKNEGKDRINITYIPSERTKTYLYDQSLKIEMDWKVIHVRIKDEPPLNKTSVVLKDNQGRLLETEISGDTSTSKSTGTAIANLTSGIIQAD